MLVLQYRTLSNRTVSALSVERDTVFWDRELTGFGVRVYPTGGKVFVAQARGPDGPDKPHKGKRITIGRHPVLSAEPARQRAALVIARAKAGEDPVPLPLPAKYASGPKVADLARRYLDEHVAVRHKPKTQRTARSVVNRHIVPGLGKLPLAAVERSHVMALHESLCETPAMANSAGTVTAIRLLMLTGCRRNEILTLPWEHVDLDNAEIRIVDGKTGSRTVHLSPSAVEVLKALPRKPGNRWVIPGAKPGTHMTDIDGAWQSVRARAGLHDVRVHDIRHAFASRALALGEGLPILGRLLGQRRAETTARYAHLTRDSVRKSAERIAVSIAADILQEVQTLWDEGTASAIPPLFQSLGSRTASPVRVEDASLAGRTPLPTAERNVLPSTMPRRERRLRSLVCSAHVHYAQRRSRAEAPSIPSTRRSRRQLRMRLGHIASYPSLTPFSPPNRKLTGRTTMASKRTDRRSDSAPASAQAAKPKTVPANKVGLSLTISDKALKDFDRKQEETIKAAEQDQKFSWR